MCRAGKKNLVVLVSGVGVAGRVSFNQIFVSFPFSFVYNLTFLAVTGRVILNNNTLQLVFGRFLVRLG